MWISETLTVTCSTSYTLPINLIFDPDSCLVTNKRKYIYTFVEKFHFLTKANLITVYKSYELTIDIVALNTNPRRLFLLLYKGALVQCSPSTRDQLPTRFASSGNVTLTRYTSVSCTILSRCCTTRNSQFRGMFTWLNVSSTEFRFGRKKSHRASVELVLAAIYKWYHKNLPNLIL